MVVFDIIVAVAAAVDVIVLFTVAVVVTFVAAAAVAGLFARPCSGCSNSIIEAGLIYLESLTIRVVFNLHNLR